MEKILFRFYYDLVEFDTLDMSIAGRSRIAQPVIVCCLTSKTDVGIENGKSEVLDGFAGEE